MRQLQTSLCFPRRLVNKASAWAIISTSGVVIAAYACRTVASSQVRNPLAQTVTGYRVDRMSLIEALQQVSYRYGLPVGIDADLQGQAAKQVSLTLPSGTVADLIDTLVHQTSDYAWREIDGVADVTPQEGGTSILDVKVKRIHLASATPDIIHNTIVSQPEVRTWLREHHTTDRTTVTASILVGRNNRTDQPRASLDAQDMSLREILNSIVKKPGFHYWIVGSYEDHGHYLEISLD